MEDQLEQDFETIEVPSTFIVELEARLSGVQIQGRRKKRNGRVSFTVQHQHHWYEEEIFEQKIKNPQYLRYLAKYFAGELERAKRDLPAKCHFEYIAQYDLLSTECRAKLPKALVNEFDRHYPRDKMMIMTYERSSQQPRQVPVLPNGPCILEVPYLVNFCRCEVCGNTVFIWNNKKYQ